jgi:hypothetical protein
MPDLYPTKCRLALLRAVDTGDVVEGITEDHLVGGAVAHTFLLDEPDEPRKVDARVKEAERAGWVELDKTGVNWRLTDAGQAVLADA